MSDMAGVETPASSVRKHLEAAIEQIDYLLRNRPSQDDAQITAVRDQLLAASNQSRKLEADEAAFLQLVGNVKDSWERNVPLGVLNSEERIVRNQIIGILAFARDPMKKTLK